MFKLTRRQQNRLFSRMLQAEQNARKLLLQLPKPSPLLAQEKTTKSKIDELSMIYQQASWRFHDAEAHSPTLHQIACHLRYADSVRMHIMMSVGKMVQAEADRLANDKLSAEQLLPYGAIALFQATKKFDATRNINFRTYARWYIRASMTRAMYRDEPTFH